MDMSLLIYIVIFLAVIVLIFKLIKKIIFAIFAVIFIFVAVFGGIGAMVYFDYQDIVERDNFNVNLVYGNVENPELGISVPYNNDEFQVEEVSSLEVNNLNEEKIEELVEEDIYIFIDTQVFEDLLSENESYYVVGTENIVMSGVELDTSLDKQEVLEIIDSSNSNEKYVEIVLEQNDLGSLEELGLDSIVEDELESSLGNVEVNEVLFVSVLTNTDENVASELVTGFKDEEVEIYPNKFSFKFLRMLPLDTIVNLIVGTEE